MIIASWKELKFLYKENKNIELNIYFQPDVTASYIKVHERFDYTELEKIFDNTDVLVAPSIWYETFGYTILEALSYGVPVIVSDRVGAKDIIPENCGKIFEVSRKDSLADTFRQLSNDSLIDMNRNIVMNVKIIEMKSVSSDIRKYCYI